MFMSHYLKTYHFKVLRDIHQHLDIFSNNNMNLFSLDLQITKVIMPKVY